MVWKLLRRNISIWQIAGYALATLVGLTVVAAAVQLYRDLAPVFAPEATPSQRMVLSKRVGVRDSFRGTAPAFTAAELEELRSMPWVSDLAPLRAADFNIHAGVELGGRSLGTALFFEALPDRFADVDSARWTFSPGSPVIPVVIPRDYLALYNFGFAASGGMPAMSESMLSAVPLTVTLAGQGRAESLPARIVGYSDWLNTIAVPETFMEWAHRRYGRGAAADPSRVVVVTSQPGLPEIDTFLESRGYVRAGAGTDLARAAGTLAAATGTIAAVGGIITLLAIGILVLSLYLLVQKNRPAISGLLMLGYTPRAVSARYIALVATVNAAVLALTSAALLLVRPLWERPLGEFGVEAASAWTAIAVAAALIAAVTALNALVITRLVRRCFR